MGCCRPPRCEAAALGLGGGGGGGGGGLPHPLLGPASLPGSLPSDAARRPLQPDHARQVLIPAPHSAFSLPAAAASMWTNWCSASRRNMPIS